MLARHSGLKNGLDGLSALQRDAFCADLRRTLPLATVDNYLDIVDYAVKTIGIDHVCLSTDFNHGFTGLTGWRDESQAGNIIAGLRKRGYDNKAIAKLASGSVLRVLEASTALAH